MFNVLMCNHSRVHDLLLNDNVNNSIKINCNHKRMPFLCGRKRGWREGWLDEIVLDIITWSVVPESLKDSIKYLTRGSKLLSHPPQTPPKKKHPLAQRVKSFHKTKETKQKKKKQEEEEETVTKGKGLKLIKHIQT